MTEDKNKFQIWKEKHPQWWRTYKRLKTRDERNTKRRYYMIETLEKIEEDLTAVGKKIRNFKGRLRQCQNKTHKDDSSV